MSAAERKLLNNWQWWAARSQSETNLKRSAQDVNSTHVNYHSLLQASLHRSTDWQLDSTPTTVGYGDFGFGFVVVTMSNTFSHKCQGATQLQRQHSRACLLWVRCTGGKMWGYRRGWIQTETTIVEDLSNMSCGQMVSQPLQDKVAKLLRGCRWDQSEGQVSLEVGYITDHCSPVSGISHLKQNWWTHQPAAVKWKTSCDKSPVLLG